MSECLEQQEKETKGEDEGLFCENIHERCCDVFLSYSCTKYLEVHPCMSCRFIVMVLRKQLTAFSNHYLVLDFTEE